MRPQFSLLFLFFLLTLCCVWAAAAFWLGLSTMMALTAVVVALHLPQAWLCSLVLAPEATKYGSVIVAISAIAITLASCGIIQSRELARKNQCLNNMKQIYFDNAPLPERHSWVDYSTATSRELPLWSEVLGTDPAGGKLYDLQSAEPRTSE